MQSNKIKRNHMYVMALAAAAVSVMVGMLYFMRRPSVEYEIIKAGPYYIYKRVFDGRSNDLVTAGFGKQQLLAEPKQRERFIKNRLKNYAKIMKDPTDDQLRTISILNKYLLSVSALKEDGYGTFFGLGVDKNFKETNGDGKIAGEEYLAYHYYKNYNVTMMVHIPSDFDVENPCIIAVSAPGSLGIYGPVAQAGEWGLKNRCAVAYTDKGSGVGIYDIDNDTVNLITGRRVKASEAGKLSHFTPRDDKQKLAEYRKKYPHRFAFKQFHSGENVSKNHGHDMLHSIQFAFFLLQQKYGKERMTREKTIIMAVGASTAGNAALRAAEQDVDNWIDGVVSSSPDLYLPPNDITVIDGGVAAPASKTTLDVWSYQNIYVPCAVDVRNDLYLNAKHKGVFLTNINDEIKLNCAHLHTLGLLQSASYADQVREARAKLISYGLLSDNEILAGNNYAGHYFLSLTHAYLSMVGGLSVTDNVCGISYAYLKKEQHKAMPPYPGLLNTYYAMLAGYPFWNFIFLVDNDLEKNPSRLTTEFGESGIKKGIPVYSIYLKPSLCMRSLITGRDEITGKSISNAMHERIARGIREIYVTGKLRGKPVIILHGRSDNISHPNHTSRRYLGLNNRCEGTSSNLHYYEIYNAIHLDYILKILGQIPLTYYNHKAYAMMLDHLRNKTELPPHQVIRAKRRVDKQGNFLAITKEDLPDIQDKPLASDRITVSNGTVIIPR